VSRQPTGTVTLLFSDIEGSTRLLGTLGDRYADTLTVQRSVLRKCWQQWRGTEMGTEGDSFFVVFNSPDAAVAAAVDAQRDLATSQWPAEQPARVRMGLHTGSPQPYEDGYVGMDVHRAARIAAAAHGGQIVVSNATASLVVDHLPQGVSIRDLGAHRLKDIPAPERIHQLTIEGLPSEFAALRTLGASSNLPRRATPLVGRDEEMGRLKTELSSVDVRLLTLTGTGGAGKTRLAIELAAVSEGLFPDGVFFVSLETANSADQLWPAIAAAIDIASKDQSPPALLSHLEGRTMLLVMDNLEQVVGVDSAVSALLDGTAGVSILATSRRPLHVEGEIERAVAPLEVPANDALNVVASSPAVKLFVRRARMVEPRFQLTASNAADVAELCRLHEGLPLALELVAARSKLLSPRALLARREQALDLAHANAQVPERQRTLGNAVAWSYELLPIAARAVFRALSVFVGGADLAAITEVAMIDRAADPLAAVTELVDLSLVTLEEGLDGEPRLRMLESTRAFGRRALDDAGEGEDVRARHANYFAAFAEEWGRLRDTPRFLEARTALDLEHDNIMEALRWAVRPTSMDQDPADATALRIGVAMGKYWQLRGYSREGVSALEVVLDRTQRRDDPRRARCLAHLANCQVDLGDLERAHEAANEAVAMRRRLGDRGALARALLTLASTSMHRGDDAGARACYEESLSLVRAESTLEDLYAVLGETAIVESNYGHHERAFELADEAMLLAQQLDDVAAVDDLRWLVAETLRNMGRIEEALSSLIVLVPRIVERRDVLVTIDFAYSLIAALALSEDAEWTAYLLGSCQAVRDVDMASLESIVAEALDVIAQAGSKESDQWDAHYARGSAVSLDSALMNYQRATFNR
jgi:predicted ATPase/class 3 adenylate cyclase